MKMSSMLYLECLDWLSPLCSVLCGVVKVMRVGEETENQD